MTNGPFWLILLTLVTVKEPEPIKSGGDTASRAIRPSDPVATAARFGTLRMRPRRRRMTRSLLHRSKSSACG